MNLPGLACVASVGVLLVAEVRGAQGLKAISKTTAAAMMILSAVVAGASATTMGRRVLLGLSLSAGGDVALLSKARPAFLLGLFLFLLAHLAYAAAALAHGLSAAIAIGLALALVVPARAVWKWLSPHVPDSMRIPVLAYTVVITAMVAMAVAATIAGASPRLAVGALLFYASDLAVARERFVVGSVINRLLGLPAYFGGQLLIASAVAID